MCITSSLRMNRSETRGQDRSTFVRWKAVINISFDATIINTLFYRYRSRYSQRKISSWNRWDTAQLHPLLRDIVHIWALRKRFYFWQTVVFQMQSNQNESVCFLLVQLFYAFASLRSHRYADVRHKCHLRSLAFFSRHCLYTRVSRHFLAF